jgi:hypothetical protein
MQLGAFPVRIAGFDFDEASACSTIRHRVQGIAGCQTDITT